MRCLSQAKQRLNVGNPRYLLAASSEYLAVHAHDALLERFEVKLRKRLEALRDVEEAVQQVRARTRPRHGLDLRRRLVLARNDVGDVTEGRGDAGHGVERAGAAVEQDEHGEAGDVLYCDVVALFLA